MTDRCPHCSFQPTSANDYCDEHRPASMPGTPARAPLTPEEVALLCNIAPLAGVGPDRSIVMLCDSHELLRAALQTVTANWKMVCERDANARRELDRQERRAEAAERDLAAAREEIQQLRAERRSGLVETEPGLWEKPR